MSLNPFRNRTEGDGSEPCISKRNIASWLLSTVMIVAPSALLTSCIPDRGDGSTTNTVVLPTPEDTERFEGYDNCLAAGGTSEGCIATWLADN